MTTPTRYSYLNDAIPGIFLGFVCRYKEIQKCLFSDCDSWVMKVEKILIHSAFILGYASPSRLVWQIFRKYLFLVSERIAGYLDDHPNVERDARMVVALLEFIGLAQIWDHVRDASLCMRFNNCDGEFFGHLSNMKFAWCGVEDPKDDSRKLSLCEKVFNESPLIMLAGGMMILMMLADSQLEVPEELVPKNVKKKVKTKKLPKHGFQKPPAPPKKEKESIRPEPPPKAYPAPDSTKKDTKPKHTGDEDFPEDNVIDSFTQDGNGDGIQTSSVRIKKRSNYSYPPGNGSSDQLIHCKCPSCSIEYYKTVPRPWSICCSKTDELLGKPFNSKGMEKEGKSKSHVTKEAQKKVDKACDGVIKKLFKDVKCKTCREKIREELKRKGLGQLKKSKEKKKSKDKTSKDKHSKGKRSKDKSSKDKGSKKSKKEKKKTSGGILDGTGWGKWPCNLM